MSEPSAETQPQKMADIVFSGRCGVSILAASPPQKTQVRSSEPFGLKPYLTSS